MRRRIVVGVVVVALTSIVLSAQTSVSSLVFTASTDHDTAALSSYVVQAVNETTGAVVFTQDIGKPTYDPVRDILTPFSSLPNLYQANGIYRLQAASLGATGLSVFALAQAPFVYCPAVVPPPPPPPPPPPG
jgi:hypothetical protein